MNNFRGNKLNFLVLALACLISAKKFAQENIGDARIIKLKEAIQLRIQNNNQLKIAKSDVAIANENLGQSQIFKSPVICLNMGYNYIGNPKVYEGFYEKNVTVDYYNQQGSASVFASYQNRYEIKRSETNVKIKSYD
jgi:outer membrane protein